MDNKGQLVLRRSVRAQQTRHLHDEPDGNQPEEEEQGILNIDDHLPCDRPQRAVLAIPNAHIDLVFGERLWLTGGSKRRSNSG